jgi:ribosomal protein S18 acetylase RimI-like enzyme
MTMVMPEPASESDAEQLASARVIAMRESLERIGRFNPQRARERFLANFSPSHTRHIVHDGQRVGFIVVREDGRDLLLDHLYIRPESQSLGIGTAVLSQLFFEAKAQGKAIRVGALRESASNRFYERHGFQLIERAEFDNYYVWHAV